GRVADLKKKTPVVVKVKSDPPGASVSMDGVAQMGITPLDVKATLGHHKFHLTSPGYEAVDKELDIEAGAEASIDASMPKSIPMAEAPAAAPLITKPAEKPPEPSGERRS